MKHMCEGRRWPLNFSRSVRCNRAGSLEHAGKWYCKTHHPPTVEAKRTSRNAERDAKYAAIQKVRQQNAEAHKEMQRRAECFDDLLAALENAVDCWQTEGLLTDGHVQAMLAAIAKAKGGGNG